MFGGGVVDFADGSHDGSFIEIMFTWRGRLKAQIAFSTVQTAFFALHSHTGSLSGAQLGGGNIAALVIDHRHC